MRLLRDPRAGIGQLKEPRKLTDKHVHRPKALLELSSARSAEAIATINEDHGRGHGGLRRVGQVTFEASVRTSCIELERTDLCHSLPCRRFDAQLQLVGII